MKLASFRAGGATRVGVALEDGTLAEVAEARGDQLGWIAACGAGGAGAPDLRHAARFAVAQVEWLPPVLTPSKIVCLALNNRALDAVKLRAPGDHPAFFLKSQAALAAHGQSIELRPAYGLTHPEPELAVVIGRRLRHATPAEALLAVFGYTIMNDITSVGMREEDTFTFRYFRPDGHGGTVAAEGHSTYPGRYKGSDTFAPLGPFVTTADAVPDPQSLAVRCWVGDQLVADDNTCNYVYGVAEALAHVSRTLTLLPGDIVSMGTAVRGADSGGAAGAIPPITRAGLVGVPGPVTVEIEQLGRLSNPLLTLPDLPRW